MPDGVHQAGKVKIAVTLDKKVFDDVCCFASNRSWPFSVAVNDLLLCGILDMKDCGEFDLHFVQDNCNAVET
jgi:hypothetical protein